MIRDEFNQIEVTNDKQLLHTEFGKTQKVEFSSQNENKLPEGDLNEKYVGKTIKKVTEDIHRFSFNTAVAALMEYVNELYKQGASEEDLIVLAKLLKPFAPHLASEMLSPEHSVR